MLTRRWSPSAAWPALGLALPFVVAARLGLGPGPLEVAMVTALLLVPALRVAGFEETSRFGRRPHRGRRMILGVLRAFAWCALGSAGALALAGAWAVAGGAVPPPSPERADAIYELDSRVATRPLPVCRPRVASQRVLLDRGAHPRLSPEGDLVWFDALADDGRRQIHRLDRASGAVTCWTCSEAGNNEHPAPGAGRRGVVFETDRYVTWREPLNHEIQLIAAGGEAPAAPSVRLTLDPASDRAPVLGQGGGLLVWSRQQGGRQLLVGAGIHGGHGGILLGAPTVVARGGLGAVTPLDWSPDGRSLLFVRGNPLGTATALRLDPATGEETPLGDGAAAVPSGSSADGGWIAFTTSTPASAVGRLPAWLGFVIAPAATLLGVETPALAGTGVQAGEPSGPTSAIDLGAIAAWGEPTGISLDPSGTSFVLGQIRSTPGGVEERLVEATLDCDPVDAAAR